MKLGHKLALGNRRCSEIFVPTLATRSPRPRDETLRAVVAEILRPEYERAERRVAAEREARRRPRSKPLASPRILVPLSVSRDDRTVIGSGCYAKPSFPGAE